MEVGEYELTRWTCFFARRLEVVAVDELGFVVCGCVFGGADFRVFFFFFFSLFGLLHEAALPHLY